MPRIIKLHTLLVKSTFQIMVLQIYYHPNISTVIQLDIITQHSLSPILFRVIVQSIILSFYIPIFIKQNTYFFIYFYSQIYLQFICLFAQLYLASTRMKVKLHQYKQIRKNSQFPLKLNLYFSMLENTLADNLKNLPFFSTKKYEQKISQIFLRLFEEEKITYLHQMISFVHNYYKNSNEGKQKQNQFSLNSIETKDELINIIQTSAQMQRTVMKLPYWYDVHFKFNKSERYVDITSKKQNFRINLALYIIRKSHNVDNCVVFQALKDSAKQWCKIYHFSLKKQIFEDIWEQLFKCVIRCRNQELLFIIKEQEILKKENELLEKNKIQVDEESKENKTLVFLSQKSIRNFLKFKQLVIKQLSSNKFQFISLLSQQLLNHPFIKSFNILQSEKYQNIFQAEIVLTKPQHEIKQQFFKAYNQKYRYLLSASVLQEDKKHKAVYEKFLFKGSKIHQVISIKEQREDEQCLLFVKGIEHIISKDYFEYITAKLVKINQVQCKLTVTASFRLDDIADVDYVVAYLLQFKDMLFRDNRKISIYDYQNEDNISEQEFYTICDDQLSYQNIQLQEGEGFVIEESNKDKLKQVYQRQDNNTHLDQNQRVSSIGVHTISDSRNHSLFISKTYLNVKHSLSPTHSTSKDTLMKDHYLYKDWTRVKAGGVKCFNEKIVNEQKKLFKKIITKMGQSILKGGGILNISLPVDIFKKESQLTSIARDFCFAPKFIQKGIQANSALQRLKYATLLAISVGNLGVAMEKPFNPILGQTLQAWIDSCPIYIQQISHHPPISAYFFQGRKYRIYGQIQTKISVGLNNAKGFSDKPNHILFEDGTKMTMVYGKMLIKGMLFGERQFTFQDKIFVYDETHNLFSEIVYGPRKRSKDPADFIHGKIYEVKNQFKDKFYANKQNHYPEEMDIVKIQSQFEGIWTQSITFNEKEYVNFKTELPHQLIDEQYALLSNSWLRMDLKHLMQNNIEEAQKYKEQMETLQRKDRNLRQKYGKHN